MSASAKPVFLLRDTLLSAIEGSIGANVWRHLFVEIDGQKTDASDNGDKSCATYVSGLLSMYGLIDRGHATVDTTVRCLKEKGWQEAALEHPEAGDVIVWGAVAFADGTMHKHIGFYVGEGMAISNDSKSGTPQRHAWDFEGRRPVTAVLRWDFAKMP